ncbi:MAG: hypothetical protein MZV64_42705 [Ignavibacteriales bacterium]|nr:hypothetical protein [Ignavibacteriales bacterium]
MRSAIHATRSILGAGGLPEFDVNDPVTLKEDEFLIAYGPKHVATGKAIYTAINVYASDPQLPVGSVFHDKFEGSAEAHAAGADLRTRTRSSATATVNRIAWSWPRLLRVLQAVVQDLARLPRVYARRHHPAGRHLAQLRGAADRCGRRVHRGPLRSADQVLFDSDAQFGEAATRGTLGRCQSYRPMTART